MEKREEEERRREIEMPSKNTGKKNTTRYFRCNHQNPSQKKRQISCCGSPHLFTANSFIALFDSKITN